ncbi:ProQ/FinO family protein [Halothiobacillus sp. DCM-1]|uniref:ProQ/FinO family protein n=1 Tax=Halothiobacillus sp. DCM-1 TaxID=3112558 RepID=UPI00324B62CF
MMNDLPESSAPVTAVEPVSAPEFPPATESAEPGTPAADNAAKKRVSPHSIVAKFIEAWPQAFFKDPRAVKPLAIGILKQMLANRPAALDGLNSHAIRAGIKFYTSRLSYHYGVRHNSHRIDLLGEPAEAIDDAARAHAEAQIAAITAARAANRPAPAEDSADEAPAPARRPRRAPRRTPVEAQTPAAEPAAEADNRPAKPKRPRQKPRPPRTDDARPSTPPAAAAASNEPGTAELSMAEKLARLAQHFGKPG